MTKKKGEISLVFIGVAFVAAIVSTYPESLLLSFLVFFYHGSLTLWEK